MSFRNANLTLAVLAVVLSGCGPFGPHAPPKQNLTLVILNNGQPLQNAHVDLSNSGGGADLNEKGEATIEAVLPGEYRVVVYPVLPISAIIPAENATPVTAPRKSASQPEKEIPKSFRDEATTPFKISVVAGMANHFELDLQKPEKQ